MRCEHQEKHVEIWKKEQILCQAEGSEERLFTMESGTVFNSENYTVEGKKEKKKNSKPKNCDPKLGLHYYEVLIFA